VKVSKRLALSAVAVAGIAFAMPAMANPHSPQGGSDSKTCNEGTVSWNPTNLWPPNHKFVPVNISYTEDDGTSPDGDTTSVVVMGVTEQDGTGTAQDATIAETTNGSGKPGQIDAQPHDNTGDPTMGSDTTAATFTEDIRAERAGTDGHGSGRTYTITVQCSDMGSETSSGTAMITVTVPHDQGVVKP
jgi:hypothetical protein